PADIGGGDHMLVVHAVSLGGVANTQDATVSFTVDKTGPVVTIDGIMPPPIMDIADASGHILFHDDGTGVQFGCVLNPGTTVDLSMAVDCTAAMGSFAYGPLMDSQNPFTFGVGAIDACGNPSNGATLPFSGDSTPPDPCVFQVESANGFSVSTGCTGGSDVTSGPSGQILFSGEATATYVCTIDGAAAVPCIPLVGVPF